ncbi:MAG: hypothetical protein IKI93_18480, partial [Clostridia bacterium]|nr:hypothetical protein [Clostridia bacterium]
MTEKELRKMSRAELLIDQMEENGRLQKQLAQAFTLLKKREITITDECFLSAEPEEVHEHTAECFALVRDALVCEL